ncbi:MAG: pyridoxal-phosphate-dependent aminotransferase family protein [Candidatus Dormibacterales bacterium]
MIFQPQLRIPGPTPLPDRVVRAMSRPMIDHRGPEFAATLAEVTAGAKRVFGTTSDLLLLSCSGTGALESMVANLVSPGESVVVASCGNFGERLIAICRAYRAQVVAFEAEWGRPVTPAELAGVLEAHPEAGVVFLTHNETSTGLTNPIRELAEVAREAGRLVAVDGVSSVSSIPVEMDSWGIDVLASGSQKGWMAPPGIAMVAASEAAWERQRKATSPRFYLDWTGARKNAVDGMTPFTPAISVVFALQEGIRMLEEEGLEAVYARHRRIAAAAAAGLEAAGFTLFAAQGYRSATVTSALPPAGLDVGAFRKLLRERFGVVLGGGQGKMKGRLVRVGHLGAVADGDMVQVLWAVERALEELDVAPAQGVAVTAACRVLSQEAAGARA